MEVDEGRVKSVLVGDGLMVVAYRQVDVLFIEFALTGLHHMAVEHYLDSSVGRMILFGLPAHVADVANSLRAQHRSLDGMYSSGASQGCMRSRRVPAHPLRSISVVVVRHRVWRRTACVHDPLFPRSGTTGGVSASKAS